MNMPGYGDPATWPKCTNHPNDPRTEDGPDRYIWEEDNPVTEWMDASALEEILYTLMHVDPETARKDLDDAIEARFQQWIDDQSQQDAEDAARDRAEARADARYWESA